MDENGRKGRGRGGGIGLLLEGGKWVEGQKAVQINRPNGNGWREGRLNPFSDYGNVENYWKKLGQLQNVGKMRVKICKRKEIDASGKIGANAEKFGWARWGES